MKHFKSPLDAIKFSFENHFVHIIPTVEDPQEWRKNRFYNEQCDNFIQAHFPLFKCVYQTYASKKEHGKRE